MPDQENRTEYPARLPKDLIDEDKRPFVTRRLIATLFGGIRFVYDENEQEYIHWSLYIFQLLIYVFMPGLILLINEVALMELQVAWIICAVVPLVLNLIIQSISYWKSRQRLNTDAAEERKQDNKSINKGMDRVAVDLTEDQGGFWKQYLFLFPARSNIWEFCTVLIVTFLYGMLMSTILNKETQASQVAQNLAIKADVEGLDSGIWLTYVTILLSSYSLFSQPIPESTPYGTNDSFQITSHHYQRCYYSIIVAIAAYYDLENLLMYQQLNFMILIFQMLGILSNPFVLILWLLEQLDIYYFGATSRASDSRVLLSFFLNFFMVWGALHVGHCDHGAFSGLYMLIGFSYLSSHNVFLALGLKKPFKVVNEALIEQRELANIVFSEMKNQGNGVINPNGKIAPVSQDASFNKKKSNQKNSNRSLWIPFGCGKSVAIKKVLDVMVFVGLTIAVLGTNLNMSNSMMINDTTIGVPLFALPFIMTAVIYLLSLIFKIYKATSGNTSTYISILMQIFVKTTQMTYYFLLLNYLKVIMPAQMMMELTEATNFYIAIYHALSRNWHNPMAASLDLLVATVILQPMYTETTTEESYFDLGYLMLAHFFVDRIHILLDKLMYCLVSIITACKNKKQRLKLQWLIFIIQGTVLLPVYVFVLLFTTLFDTATVPFLGFAYFTIGYPKPQRCWSTISPVSANPKDPVSDAYLYQSMLPQLQAEINKLITSDPFNFTKDSFYLLKNEKMIIFIQVFERGNDYAVYSTKGLELQETTVCHAEENDFINQVSENFFQKRKPAPIEFSIRPMQKLSFSVYEDIKFSLAGTIENHDFGELVKKYFMRVLAYKTAQKLSSDGNTLRLRKILQGSVVPAELEQARPYIDNEWMRNHLQVDTRTVSRDRSRHGSAGEQFRQPQVQPNQASQRTNSRGTGSSTASPAINKFNSNQNDLPPIIRKSREESKRQPIQDDGIDDLVDLLDSDYKKPNQKPNAQNMNIKKQTEPINEVNELDDLDNMLDQFGGPSKNSNGSVTTNAAIRRQEVDSNGSGAAIANTRAEIDDWGTSTNENVKKYNLPAPQQSQQNQNQQKKQQLSESALSDFELLMYESFTMLFRDKFSTMPIILYNVFQGKLKEDMDTRDFLRSKHIVDIELKHLILYSARLAFHMSMNKFFEGEVELPENSELKKEIEAEDGQWFLGAEEFLWNTAIERHQPQLMRIIKKKGVYFAHQLKLGKSKDSEYTLFQFRREVIRGIWGNQNQELLYYTNANDERFSIQAEKDILRNLLVQLAEVPLGYPVYSSGARQAMY